MGLDSEIAGQTTIEKIPENILLEILRYLPVKDRCLVGRVCKQWRRIVSDNSLWRHVDLLEYRLDLKRMWKVLRAHFSPSLQSLKIRGCAHADCRKRNKASVSDAMLKELSSRCPNLSLLHLHDCNTDNLSFESLPLSIRSLSITKCSWQPRWMKDKQNLLPNLERLDLSLSVRVDSFDLEDISAWKSLKTLSLSGCYRIKGTGVEAIARNVKVLETLDLSGCEIDDLAIHHIARHLKNLQELHLANCSAIGDSSLATLAAGLPKLSVLDISYCDSVTVAGLESLYATKIRHLTVFKKVRLTEEEMNALKSGFPHQIVLEA